MNQSENINEFAAAFAKAQGQMLPVYKDKKVAFDTKSNDKVKYKYADLASAWDSCRQPLSSNGIGVIQGTEKENGEWVIATTLIHSSGQWMRSTLPINVNVSPTALGSCLTYMRRYALCAMVGLAPEDDDGQEANKEYESPVYQKPNPIHEKLGNTEIIMLNSLVKELDEASNQSFYAWIKKAFNASDLSDIPKAAFDNCLNSINAKIKYIKNNKQETAVA